MRWLVLAAVSGMVACAGTRMTVRVEPPKNTSKAGFYAAIGSPGDRCVPAGHLDMTDETGTTVVQEEFCGKLQLVVAAPNYQTERKVLDTCNTKFVQVDVHPAAPITDPSDECSTAAMRVMQMWLSEDADALRQELVDPNDLPLYIREGQLKPWRLVYEPSPPHGDECAVHVSIFYDAGCEAAVRVDLLRVGDAWRLRGIQ
jgi:hypothetical protein